MLLRPHIRAGSCTATQTRQRDVERADLVKVLDFGLARKSSRPENGSRRTHMPLPPILTDAGLAVGTVSYMSPETGRSERVDARSDIFSFGCVLYEMLTGKRAFQGDNRFSIAPAGAHQRAASPARSGSWGTSKPGTVVENACEKAPRRCRTWFATPRPSAAPARAAARPRHSGVFAVAAADGVSSRSWFRS